MWESNIFEIKKTLQIGYKNESEMDIKLSLWKLLPRFFRFSVGLFVLFCSIC